MKNKPNFLIGIFKNKKTIYWRQFRSIFSRLIMILYIIILNYNVVQIFDECLFYLNYLFIILIAFDGFFVLCLRNGLEDSWCSLSILFYVTASMNAIFMVEINLNSYWGNIFQKEDFMNRIDSEYKRLSESTVLTKVNVDKNFYDSDKHWFEGLEKVYEHEIAEFEIAFCYVLIVVRFLIPQGNSIFYQIQPSGNAKYNLT